MRIQYILSISLLLILSNSFAQRGKDGNKTVTGTEVVNAFTLLTADVAAGSTSISVTSSALSTNFTGNLAQGDLLMLIQVQGVSIEDTVFPNPGPNFGNSSKFFNTWGSITNYNNCGNHEFVQVAAVPNGTSITLDCSLQFDYTATGKVLVIRVPRYSSLTINNGGTLTTSAWNGTSGGVLALEVNGVTTINSGGTIDVSNLGFRGGTALNSNQSSVFGGGRYADSNPLEGAEKGEGIYGDQSDYDLMNDGGARQCRGAAANAGGGGNGHNAGGGGGSNAGNPSNWNNGVGVPDPIFNAAWARESPSIASVTSSGGGRGGYSFFDVNLDPLNTNPGPGNGWGGDNRSVVGGLGGRPLDYSTGKIFIGGGGGSGEGNDGEAGDGGNGGGIIFMTTYGDITGSGKIFANGEDGGDVIGTTSFSSLRGKDAGGGAGGGGTIILQTTGTVLITDSISANGGIGGDQELVAGGFYGPIDEGEGPGGGAGGGYIAISAGSPTTFANGGISGVTNCPYVSNFPANGATSGGIGMPNENINSYEIVASGTSICSNTTATLNASLSGNPPAGTVFEWYDAEFGGTLLFTGANFTTPSLTTNTTYWVKVCPAPYLVPVLVTVTPCSAMIADFSSSDSTLCLGDCIDFTDLTDNTPTGWTWYFFGSDSTNSAVQNPTNICYNTAGSFDVALVANNATLQDSIFIANFITVSALPTVVASATDTNLCIGDSTTLSGSGATSYTWTNSVIDGVIFAPTNTALYTVTGTDANNCVNTDTITINVNPLPTVVANPTSTSICTGDSVTLTGSGASSYTWDNSVVDGVAFIPAGTNTYTVTGTDGNGCSNTDQTTVTVSVCGVPPIADFGATDSTICLGDCIDFNDLSTAVPTGWTWYFFGSATANSAVQNPTTICYNTAGTFDVALVATNATGQDSLFMPNFITVNALPTVIANATNTSVCSGNPVTLTGSGANSYTWDNSVVDGVAFNPTTTQTYTVTGTDINGCIDTNQIIVAIDPCTTPVASFNNVSSACINDCIDFTDNSANTPTNWTWYFFGGSPSSSSLQNPTAICYDTVGTFAVALVTSNAFGQDSIYIGNAVTVDSCTITTTTILIPNVLTPNGDGQNDIFVTDGNGISSLHTQIYNRWGMLLYESNLVREGWDGRTRAGKEAPEGTYFYIITANLGGKVETFKGSLTLIR
jgi:gliding motility-associated-like protein